MGAFFLPERAQAFSPLETTYNGKTMRNLETSSKKLQVLPFASLQPMGFTQQV